MKYILRSYKPSNACMGHDVYREESGSLEHLRFVAKTQAGLGGLISTISEDRGYIIIGLYEYWPTFIAMRSDLFSSANFKDISTRVIYFHQGVLYEAK